MKARYVSPVTEILYTEISPVMDKISTGLRKGDILHDASTQTDNNPAPEIGGNEEHTGGEGDDLDAAKRNWNCWDIE